MYTGRRAQPWNAPAGPTLPAELRLHILSLLPPNDLALGGRLSSKDAAQHFREPSCRTAHSSQPLSDYAVTAGLDSARAALRQLTFKQKLQLPATAAASGCEANVEFALQLLQPHVFPELLQADHGYAWGDEGEPFDEQQYELPYSSAASDLGSAAVASGLAHLLPSLAQRCPGLLHPRRTLEAAARQCDLAGLHAAWEVLGQRLLGSIEENAPDVGSEDDEEEDDDESEQQALRRMMAEAAGSSTPDALAKMAWVLETGGAHARFPVLAARVWGAAAASGDLARLRWLREHGYPWQSVPALHVAIHHASLGFLQEMEQQGCLPPAGAAAWRCIALDCSAASSPRDSAAKLRWLAGRGPGVAIDRRDVMKVAAGAGNLEALQLLLGHWQERQAAGARIDAAGHEAGVGDNPLDSELLAQAVDGGHVPTAEWLLQAGCPLRDPGLFIKAIRRGDLPMVRWLLEAGCLRGELTVADLVQWWPSRTAADSAWLVEAVRLMAAAGVPVQAYGMPDPYDIAAVAGQPWPVWCVLRDVLPVLPAPGHARRLPYYAVRRAARGGCTATIEALVGEGLHNELVEKQDEDVWYAAAAGVGDRGTLACLRRLKVPLRRGVLGKAIREHGLPQALRWLVEQGAPIDEEDVRAALESVPLCLGHTEEEQQEVVAWLRGLRGGGPQVGCDVVVGVDAGPNSNELLAA